MDPLALKTIKFDPSCLNSNVTKFDPSKHTKESIKKLLQEYNFNPSIHTKESLRKIVHEMFIDTATLYCSKLRLMRQAKSSGELDDKKFAQFLGDTYEEVTRETLDLFKKNGISQVIFSIILREFEDDQEIKDKMDQI